MKYYKNFEQLKFFFLKFFYLKSWTLFHKCFYFYTKIQMQSVSFMPATVCLSTAGICGVQPGATVVLFAKVMNRAARVGMAPVQRVEPLRLTLQGASLLSHDKVNVAVISTDDIMRSSKSVSHPHDRPASGYPLQTLSILATADYQV